MINDSGNRTKFESGAVRDIQEGKGRCDLLPLDIIDLWCDDGLQCTLYYVGEYLKRNGTTDYFELVLNEFATEHQAKRFVSGESIHNKFYPLEEYRWNLVLEVAKHFEEGAKKYGDRNWEKGIPCDRYIDSAVRHYCKWRAGWDDEPHDRAFIWNILCCEWTRLRYGWNLERLETAKKYENILGMKTELLDHKGLMSGTLRSVASSFNNKKRFTRSACLYLYDRYGQPAGRVWILNAYKSANLYAAIGNVWKRSDDVTLKILEAELSKHEWKPGVDFIVEAFDDEKSESKKFEKIGKQLSKGVQDGLELASSLYGEKEAEKIHWGCSQLTETEIPLKQYDDIRLNDDTEITMTVEGDFGELFNMLNIEEPEKDQEIDEKSDIKEVLETISECEYNTEPLKTLIDYVEKSLKVQERRNPCIKDTDTGWHFYDIDGRLVAYIFDFKEPEEGKKRQLGRMLHKVWREVTGSPYTIKRIVEEWGYVCGKDFSICITPSEVAKEYKLCNRRYNEEK